MGYSTSSISKLSRQQNRQQQQQHYNDNAEQKIQKMNQCDLIRYWYKFVGGHQWPLLLIWFNFNPSMDK